MSKESLSTIIKELEKKYGEGTIMKFTDRKTVDIETISTGSISIDHALGIKGIPRGRIIEIFGPESSGKTTLALSIIAQAQKKGITCAFVDAEHALDPDYSKNIGVDLSKLFISQPNSGEQALDIVEGFVKSGEVGLIVVDSVAALTPQAEIDGVMGQTHIGLQARLMSQALRKLTAIAAVSKTSIIFINQIRMMIGVKWGCVHSNTMLHTDGKTIPAYKVKKNTKIISYDTEKEKFIETKIKEVFLNGEADKDEFIKLKMQSKDNNLYQVVILTKKHKVFTEKGWKEAQNLTVKDRLLSWGYSNISSEQEQIIIGSLFSDGQITKRSQKTASYSLILRNSEQKEYSKWKIKNLNCFYFSKKRNTNYFSEWNTSLQYLYDSFYNNKYSEKIKKETGKNYRSFPEQIVEKADKLAFAVWYLDDGGFSLKKDKYIRNDKTAALCIKRLHSLSKTILKKVIVRMKELGWEGVSYDDEGIYFDKNTFSKFSNDIKEHVLPEMQYKLLPEHRGCFKENKYNQVKQFKQKLYLDFIGFSKISKKESKKLRKFDFGTALSTYMVGSSKKTNGIVIHNSPETTSGGTALKFYTSQRIEVRRAAKLKKDEEIIGNRVKIKIAKNKLAAPFKTTEVDIIFNKGISYESDVIQFGLKKEIIKKEGITFYFGNEKIGKGLENARIALESNPEMVKKIVEAIDKDDEKIKETNEILKNKKDEKLLSSLKKEIVS